MSFSIQDLPYAFDALEPVIDARTMEIHYSKHHAGYVSKLEAAVTGQSSLAGKSVEELLSNLSEVPESVRTAVRNNAGGHFNHSLFWPCLAPSGKGGGGQPSGDLAAAIDNDLGGFDKFKEAFSNAAATRFGSGWAWLCLKSDNKLCVCSTPNQDNPLMNGVVECPGKPILGLDVWEHAYYLNYQNRRPDYIAAWWDVVNWNQVAKNFQQAKS